MHLICLNLTDLLFGLWRGTLKCGENDLKATWSWAILHDFLWEEHGEDVRRATPYLPGSFDRPPRNPAEKASSGYKAWEWLMYVFGMGPAVFYGVLEEPYYSNFCLLVHAIRILHQRTITRAEMIQAHNELIQFVDDYERLYYQGKSARLHFVRQSIHGLLHLSPGIPDYGPLGLLAQWTMERTIGNLTEEIRQPSNAFMNLAERCVIRAQVNAIKSMYPQLQDAPVKTHPDGAQSLGDGYYLLHAKDNCPREVRPCEEVAIKNYYASMGRPVDPNWHPRVTRWARLEIPTQQIARSLWKESKKPLEQTRMARNVKVCLH